LETLRTLRRQVEYLSARHPDRTSWSRAWLRALQPPGEGPVRVFVRGWYLTDRRPPRGAGPDLLRYRLMRPLHRWLFERGPLNALFARLLSPIRRGSRADRLLVRLERALKTPLFGCRACGYCRLGETQYICPESCPKGLANGACGGTDGDTCEFGDRTCIHSRRYRVAATLGRTADLATGLVPPVPEAIRGSSSWPPHFRRETPDLECRR
ncbi:MAG: methylenetetrahydrofolate reductase, partial [Gammaproteobacteria bacterium]